MSYYDTYVQGYTLRELPESKKKLASRRRKALREKFISDLNEDGK